MNQTYFIRNLIKAKAPKQRISKEALQAIDTHLTSVATKIIEGSRTVDAISKKKLVSKESVHATSTILGFSTEDTKRAEKAVQCYFASRSKDSCKQSSHSRAKLNLSVARVHSQFYKKGGARVRDDALVYLTGLLECVCEKMLKDCQKILQCDESGRKMITCEDVQCVIAL